MRKSTPVATATIVVTIVVTMPINFVVNKLWTFRAVRNRYQERSAEAPAQSGTEAPAADPVS